MYQVGEWRKGEIEGIYKFPLTLTFKYLSSVTRRCSTPAVSFLMMGKANLFGASLTPFRKREIKTPQLMKL